MNQTYGQSFRLTLITKNVELAKLASMSGVDRIGIDLEIIGKAERQKEFNTRLSHHAIEDLLALALVIPREKLLVRINPLNNKTIEEVENILELGASHIMLPYFSSESEVDKFLRIVDRRARSIALVETKSAVTRIREICKLPGLDEVMIGLNDLRMSMGLHNHFELLASPVMQIISSTLIEEKIPFSIGGVAPPAYRHLPVDPDLVLAQYPRLGATGAWLSRSFFKEHQRNSELVSLVSAIRNKLDEHIFSTPNELEHKRKLLEIQARNIRDGGISL